MKYIIIVLLFFSVSFAKEKSKKEKSLCFDNFCLGSLESKIISKDDDLVSNVIFKKEKEIFSDIFNLQISKPAIKFKKIVFYKQKYILFINQKRIIAIAGFSKEFAVLKDLYISDGIENIVFKLGNQSLKVFNEKNRALYLYNTFGFAFFDDGKDDVIDLFLLFKPVSN